MSRARVVSGTRPLSRVETPDMSGWTTGQRRLIVPRPASGDMTALASFLFGFLVEIATGLVIAAGMGITRGSMAPTSAGEFPPWVPIVAIVAGTGFTFLIAWWRAARNPNRPLMHALLVAAGAVLLHLVTSLGSGQALTIYHILADVLKLVAGVGAGTIVQHRVARDRGSA